MKRKRQHILPALLTCIVLLATNFQGCEKQVPLSSFDFNYEPQYKIEADIYPQNLGKSVLRIDRTFTIADSMSVEDAHIRDADARLLDSDGSVLSTFSWHDSAASYLYYDNQEDSPFPDSLNQVPDTMIYGAYTLDRVNFDMPTGAEYQLRVVIDDEVFTTTFSPYPLVDFLPFAIDSVVMEERENGPGTYECIYATMSVDTARLRWEEDPDAYLYTVIIEELEGTIDLGIQAFAFPGPALNLGLFPGTYRVIIGAMDERFYHYYYLSDFPPNHPNRNFFGDDALGYAGSVNERYLQLTIVP